MSKKKDYTTQFQTPPAVCRYMASLIPGHVKTVLEPTPGIGNLVSALSDFKVTAPVDYFTLDPGQRYDAIVMNPPFSATSANLENAPTSFLGTGMRFGYQMLMQSMHQSDHIIALMPWFTISDSDVRMRCLKRFGLKSITTLPRKTFQYARIQTCILELEKGYVGKTTFEVFEMLPHILSEDEKCQMTMFAIDLDQ